MVQENRARQQLQAQGLSFEQFLAQLDLQIEIRTLDESLVARVSQLTQRTNQFNSTTIRRSEAEVAGPTCQVVHVRDRFGDYGVVGAMFYKLEQSALKVDSFLLSCRALGRGVEESMLTWLGEEAGRLRLLHVEVQYIPSQKNRPVLDFLKKVGATYQQPERAGSVFCYPVDVLKKLQGKLLTIPQPTDLDSQNQTVARPEQESQTTRLHRIQREQWEPEQILKQIQNRKPIQQRKGNAQYRSPRTPEEEVLAGIWAEILHMERVSIHDNFFELGGHSLMAIQLMARIEQAFHVPTSLPALFQNPTVAQFASLVTERTTLPWSPIVPLQPHGSRTPLFCIHPAGGFAICYTDLARQLGTDQPLYGLQARGLDEQQAPHTSIYEMAACYRDAIQHIQTRRPYLLAGWSLGGIIAYEISQQLMQQGEEVAFLALLDTQIASDAPEPDKHSLLIEYLGEIGQPIEQLNQMISETDDVVSKAFVIMQQSKLISPDLCLADFQRYVEVYETNAHAACAYQPQPYAGSATLFISHESLATRSTETQANIDRWSGLIHNLELREAPGLHQNMFLPPYIDDLAAQISICLRRAMNFHET